jgi:integrase
MKQSRKEKLLQQHPYAISQGKDGRWRTYIPDDTSGKGRKMIAKSSLEKLEEAVCEYYISAGTTTDNDITLAQLFPLWLEHKSLRVEPTTINRDKKDWKRYYQDSAIVNKPIRNLKKVELDEWLHRHIGKNKMTKHQLAHLTTIIKQELDYAVDLEIIDRNPYDLIKLDRKRLLAQEHKKPDGTQIFYDAELIKIYEHAWEDFKKDKRRKHKLVPLAVMFMFQTGLRLSEVSAVKYEDISGDTITIRRMVQYETGAVIEGTKGTFGDRIVPLTPEAKKLIEYARKKQSEAGVPSDGFIFSMVDVPKNTYKAIGRAFEDYCKDIGIMQKSSHKARKTYISRLLADGVNINTVRSFVGHKDERTTYSNYCYDTKTDAEKYSQVVNALAV